jgi:hypothetical protein
MVSFCVAGVVTYPMLDLYANFLLGDRDAPPISNIAAHLSCVVSAILMELLAIALFSKFRSQSKNAEQNAEPALPITGF